MSSSGIRFGTDGWRAVIADGFTVERLMRAAQASARVMAETYQGDGILIGYDHRFLSETFAQQAAEAVAAIGIPVTLADRATPTPALSWAALQRGSLGALVITASHNPPQYSGLKVKGSFGGSVPSEVTHEIERVIDQEAYVSAPAGSPIDSFDPWPDYCQQLSRKVDLTKLKRSPAKVWVDVMHGSAAGGMTRLLGDHVQELRSVRDPLFGGMAPEPLAPQLAQTMEIVKQATDPLKVGIVFDGDGDRIAAVDGQGNYLSSQVLIPILIEHLAIRRGMTGKIVKTVSGSQLFAKVAALYQLPIQEMAVGFKYIADVMMREPVLLGGEESGGIGYLDHMPERDAMLSALYLLEAVADSGSDLGQLYATLQAKTGYVSVYRRRDLHFKDAAHQVKLLRQLVTDPPAQIAGQLVMEHVTTDGHKFVFADSSWLMIRGSGTEPLLRLYSEATNLETVERLLGWAAEWAAK